VATIVGVTLVAAADSILFNDDSIDVITTAIAFVILSLLLSLV
jgi:hypothetical protein